MPSESPPLVLAVEELLQRRAVLQAEIGEINAQLEQVAALIGVMPPPNNVATARSVPTIDRRRAGSLVEFLVEFLSTQSEGLTRSELKAVVGAHPEFGPKLRNNENGFYNAVSRLLRRTEIREVGGLLYAPSNAPTDALEVRTTEASGANISLFGPLQRGAVHG
jgi:hypothetical protein